MIILIKENEFQIKDNIPIYMQYYKYLDMDIIMKCFLKYFKDISKVTPNNRISKYSEIFNIGSLYFNNYKNLKIISYKRFNILIIKMYKLKLNLIIINKNECKLNLTPGIILKKLNLIEKNMKKDIKIINYMIKVTFDKLDLYFKKTNYLINLIGLGKNYSKIIKFLKKNTKIKKNLFLINVNRNKNIKKIKKIKSIKKNIKKKIIKL